MTNISLKQMNDYFLPFTTAYIYSHGAQKQYNLREVNICKSSDVPVV